MFLLRLLPLDLCRCSVVVRHTVQLCVGWEGNLNVCGSCSWISAHDWPAFRDGDDSDPLTGRANYSTFIFIKRELFIHFPILWRYLFWIFFFSQFPLCYSLSSSSHWDLRSALAFFQFWSPASPTQLVRHCRSFSFSSGLNATSSSSWTMARSSPWGISTLCVTLCLYFLIVLSGFLELNSTTFVTYGIRHPIIWHCLYL